MGRNSLGGTGVVRERMAGGAGGTGWPDGAGNLSLNQAGSGSIMGMETRKNPKTSDVSQLLDAASTARLDVQKAQCDMASHHSSFMC